MEGRHPKILQPLGSSRRSNSAAWVFLKSQILIPHICISVCYGSDEFLDSDLRQSADSCNRRSRVCGGALEIGAGAFAEDQQASVNSPVDSAEKDSLVLTTGIDTPRHLPSMIDQQLTNSNSLISQSGFASQARGARFIQSLSPESPSA